MIKGKKIKIKRQITVIQNVQNLREKILIL